jgi:dipeptidyl aminopeptidase/acylaminoacyl peptidase
MNYFFNKLAKLFLFATSWSHVQAHEKDFTWTPQASMNTKNISDVRLSPDNKTVLFVVKELNVTEEKKFFLSKIYKMDFSNKKTKPLFSSDTSFLRPRWSPNGQWVAFLSDEKGVSNLCMTSAKGGKIIPLVTGKESIQTFSWSPDSKKIAFVMADETQEEKNKKRKSSSYLYKQSKIVNKLWVLDAFSKKTGPKPLTSDQYNVKGSADFDTANSEFDWSPDSKNIVFAYSSKQGLDSYYLDSSLAIVNTSNGVTTSLKKNALYEAMPRFSFDGKQIAYLSCNSSKRYTANWQPSVRLVDEEKYFTLASTFNAGPHIAGPNLLGWSKDGKDLLFFEPKGTKFHLVLVPVNGAPVKEIETGDTFFTAPSLSDDKTMLSFVAQSPSTPPEAFVSSLDNFKPIQVSALNNNFLSYPKIETNTMCWKSEDGMEIEGLVTYPVGYEKGKKYPLLVFVHGGPMMFFKEEFLGLPSPYPLASFAQEGFVVFRPNVRGSSGYGKSFRCDNYNDWGGEDFKDIMTGVDALIEKGIADPERLGIMGWSYGGYMTAWAVTQTDRFKAASIGAALSNLVSMSGTTDLYRLLPDYLGDYIENEEFYKNRSPIFHTHNVKTPCLIQHGTADVRVPVSQAHELYHALEKNNKKPTLILYPGEGHGLVDPELCFDAMEHNLDWFSQYLL